MNSEPTEMTDTKTASGEKSAAPSVEQKDSFLALAANFTVTFLIALLAIIALVFAGLKLFGVGIFYVNTGSMEPEYPVNSIVFSQKVEPSTIKVGDVITYAISDKDSVTHRVIAADADAGTFTTKGDNNNVEDAPVLWGNVRGKVIFSIRFGGSVIRFITAEEHRLLFIIIIAVLLIGTIVWDVVERAKKRKLKTPKS